MKKFWMAIGLLFLLISIIPVISVAKEMQHKELDYQVIPDEAIRLRILANSDSEKDQELKHKVRDEVNEVITEWVKDIDDIEEARKLIQENLPELEEVIRDTLEKENSDEDFELEYGENVSFPAKLYGNYLYPAGEYEAILVTIGEGSGANWWCVLFPPLCFLDFFNGTSVASDEVEEVEEEEEVEVDFFLFKWLGLS
ncbi:stage II sporulation protein R [Oceanobacillus jeddahense]|uniref:Stage II sporulation protein R n=1 Tax=Oceanobacillus jeddahense TaxID=1462527 RepID=A0ABY5JS68_9BACI|nr:stage II sporulation protein R [Oceanobacillus jeddahense]UUI02629.1 stage II sporulation protein R [Oceanobacillus jeddahense]